MPGDVGGDVAGLDSPVEIPDPDRTRVDFVVGLGHERDALARREALVLERIRPVRGPGDPHDVESRILPPDDLVRGRVAEPVARARPLEPEPEPLAGRRHQNASSLRTDAATRSAEGMYASSICQYG